MAMLVQDFFNLVDPPGPYALSTCFLTSFQSYDGLPFDNSTRPTELPDLSTVNNTAINSISTLSSAPATLPSPRGQDACVPVLNPKVVVGTSWACWIRRFWVYILIWENYLGKLWQGGGRDTLVMMSKFSSVDQVLRKAVDVLAIETTQVWIRNISDLPTAEYLLVCWDF